MRNVLIIEHTYYLSSMRFHDELDDLLGSPTRVRVPERYSLDSLRRDSLAENLHGSAAALLLRLMPRWSP